MSMMAFALEKQAIMAGLSDPMVPSPFCLQRVRKETYDTFTLQLEPANGASEFSFAAGQFNMLYAFGVGEVPISISGDPTKPQTLVHTVRAVGTATQALCKLKRGEVLGVRGPFGNHWPVEEAAGSDVVIVAGGIGLAPLRPALYYLLSNREKYGRIALVYGARTLQDMLYKSELERWRSHFDLEVKVTVDTAPASYRGNVGVVTTLIPRVQFDPFQTVALVCGPEVMMRFTVRELESRGMEPESIFISMERNMRCGIGFCGHCQFGSAFVCRDGPVFCYAEIEPFFAKREI
jgi:NAD(P)H-flavin reductase